jgi:Zn-dependent alcohol dehydrogenases
MTPTTQRVPRFAGDRRIEAWVRPVPAPDFGELLIRVRANALCGTDRSQYLHGSDVVPGHEAAGTVAEVGPGTTTPVGTPGVVFLMDFCGACRSCRLALTNQCLAKRADMGFTRDGGYGAYELVSESNFFPIGADLPFADATLLLDVMGTTGHALERASLVRPDIGSVVVAGAGCRRARRTLRCAGRAAARPSRSRPTRPGVCRVGRGRRRRSRLVPGRRGRRARTGS